ncbi:hypothetical protein D3C76_938080 [compost metagenome]
MDEAIQFVHLHAVASSHAKVRFDDGHEAGRQAKRVRHLTDLGRAVHHCVFVRHEEQIPRFHRWIAEENQFALIHLHHLPLKRADGDGKSLLVTRLIPQVLVEVFFDLTVYAVVILFPQSFLLFLRQPVAVQFDSQIDAPLTADLTGPCEQVIDPAKCTAGEVVCPLRPE